MRTSASTTLHQGLQTQISAAFLFFAKIIAGSLLIAVSAQIAIPFWPVPMTLQTSAIMAIGLIASPSVAVGSVLAYIVEGVLGIPVFSSFSSGISVLFGTTGGYIVGFVPMIHIISSLKDRRNTFFYQFSICLLATLVLYMMGVSYLALFVGGAAAIQLGLTPFIIKIPVGILFALFGVDVLKGIRSK